jgi:16S rRNA (guanine966-N2)-methyltransferase
MRIIAGRWGGRLIDAPTGGKTRPTTDRVREAWMSALQPWIPGARVLDLFAGSGALGLETLSRGAIHVTFVERANSPLRALRGNVEKLGAADGAEIVRGDALAFVQALPAGAYDVALADPPYGEGLAAALVHTFAATPFAAWLWIEHRKSDIVPELPGARSRKYGDTIITSIPAPE